MSSVVVAGNNSHYPEKEAIALSMAVDLLAAGSEGQGDEVIRILEVDIELLWVGDLNGDTVFHLLVSGGYVKPLLQLLKFLLSKNPKLLKEVVEKGNAHGDTPLLMALDNGHREIAVLLEKVMDTSFYEIMNDDGNTALALGDEIRLRDYYVFLFNEEENEMRQNEMCDEVCNTLHRFKNEELSPHNENKDTLRGVYEHLLNVWDDSQQDSKVNKKTSSSDIEIERRFMAAIVEPVLYENKIFEMLDVDRNLIQYKNWRGETILHQFAYSGDMDVLTKLVGHLVATSRMTRPNDQTQLPVLTSLLEGDRYGWTPLHQAINRGNMEVSRYLMKVAPEAAYRVNNDGESPLYVSIKEGHDELVKYMLQVMPEASMSKATRSSLLTPNKKSLAHAAIRFRNLSKHLSHPLMLVLRSVVICVILLCMESFT